MLHLALPKWPINQIKQNICTTVAKSLLSCNIYCATTDVGQNEELKEESICSELVMPSQP